MRPSPPVSAIAVLLLCGAALSVPARAAEPAPGNSGGAAPVAAFNVVKYAKGLTVAGLAGRPDSDLVEFANGRHATVGDLRKLEAIQRDMMAARPHSRRPLAFDSRADASRIVARIAAAPDLAAVLQRPPGDTVQFPSGHTFTVEQIKFVLPEVERRLGHPVVGAGAPNKLTGESVAVSNRTTRAEWEAILAKPDGTVVQTPDGKHRVTVGQLKQYRAAHPNTGAGKNAGSVPLVPFAVKKGGPK